MEGFGGLRWVYLRDAWVGTKVCLAFQEASKTCICGASATIIDDAYRGGESHERPEVHLSETGFEFELHGTRA